MPAASMTRPTRRVTRPRRVSRGRSPMRDARRLRSIDLGHATVYALERLVDATVDDSIASFDETAAARDTRIGEPACVARAGDRRGFVWPCRRREHGEIDGIHANTQTLIDWKFGESTSDEVRHDLAIEADLSGNDLSRNDDRERGDSFQRFTVSERAASTL